MGEERKAAWNHARISPISARSYTVPYLLNVGIATSCKGDKEVGDSGRACRRLGETVSELWSMLTGVVAREMIVRGRTMVCAPVVLSVAMMSTERVFTACGVYENVAGSAPARTALFAGDAIEP